MEKQTKYNKDTNCYV